MALLTPVTRKFVVHWGEMGTRWGINRTVAQVHALLWVSPRPLHAEEITEALSVSRSNVSTSLRELQAWGIVRVVHVLGDRRDHFETMKDVWEMFQVIVDERKRREIDPTVQILRECVTEAEAAGSGEAHARKRLSDMLDFCETITNWYDTLRRMPTTAMARFLKSAGSAKKLLTLAR
ncbi:MAG TPA: MarR family transcriptional regulator [Terriglobales bacterium]|nr:MarR family transcriptional regulator [Terriglobales bacterium]